MICIKCGKEFDDSLKACPECGAAAAVPVIPDTPVKLSNNSAPLPIIKESRAAVTDSANHADTPKQSSRGVKIIAVAAAVIIPAAAAVFIFANKGGSLKADSEPETHKSSISSTSSVSVTTKKTAKNISVTKSNTAAKMIYDAVCKYATDREIDGDIIPFGSVCSSDMAGVTSDNILYDGDTVRELEVCVNNALGEEYAGYEWVIGFNDGAPTTVYTAPNTESKYIGSYPQRADKETMLSLSEGRDTVYFDGIDGTKSANDLYG